MTKPMKLADYLDMFLWSQADLAREADISTHCVSRAINGKRIARRKAAKHLSVWRVLKVYKSLTCSAKHQDRQGNQKRRL